MLATVLAVVLTGAPFFLGGIQVNEDDHRYWVSALSGAGMNTVAVTVYAKQGDWDGANLWWEAEEPAVVAEIRTAKAAGLKVVLVLRVALDHAFVRNRFLWHGMIMPASDPDLDEWFRRYREFVARWARTAEALGVDVLGVASEMSWLTSTRPVQALPGLPDWFLDRAKQRRYRAELKGFSAQIERKHLRARGAAETEDLASYLAARGRANVAWARLVTYAGQPGSVAKINARRRALDRHWRRVISGARKHFSRPITYAANFDQYQDVTFWDALDLIGVNAYFQLRTDPEPIDLTASLERGWRDVFERLLAFRRDNGLSQPVMFTELGYTSRRHSTLEPWQSGGFSVVGPSAKRKLVLWADEPHVADERAAAVRALRRVSQAVAPDLLAGLLYWKLSTQAEHHLIEPFVLVVSAARPDPLQPALLSFVAGLPE